MDKLEKIFSDAQLQTHKLEHLVEAELGSGGELNRVVVAELLAKIIEKQNEIVDKLNEKRSYPDEFGVDTSNILGFGRVTF